MSVLAQLVSRIPGLDDYNDQVKANNAQTGANIQQGSQFMTLQQAMADAPLKRELLQAQVEEHRGKVNRMKRMDALAAQVTGGGADQMTPDQLEKIGQFLAMGEHPGAATILGIADKRRALAQARSSLEADKSQTVQAPIDQVVAPNVNLNNDAEVAKMFPTDEQGRALTRQTVSNEPNPQGLTSAPVQIGGRMSALMAMPGMIGNAAKDLQRIIDSPNSGGLTPAQIENRANSLWTMASAQEAKRGNQQFIVDNRPEPKIPQTWHPTPQGYMKDGPNGPEPVLDSSGKPVMPTNMAKTMVNGITPENAGLRGGEFLKTLEPNVAKNVEGLLDYTVPLTSYSTRTGERAAMIAMAKQADPSFDVNKYQLRYGLRQDFTKGKTSENIVALDQGINHMGTLLKLGDALQNNDLKALNSVVNFVKDQTGDESVNDFKTAKQAVGTELMRVFRQVNASEKETEAWEKRFAESNSPAQLKGAIKIGAELLNGRLKAINQKWNRGMDTNTGFPGLLSPDADAALRSFGVTPAGSTAGGSSPVTPPAPQSANPRDVTLPNGQIKTFPTPAAAQAFRAAAGL